MDIYPDIEVTGITFYSSQVHAVLLSKESKSVLRK